MTSDQTNVQLECLAGFESGFPGHSKTDQLTALANAVMTMQGEIHPGWNREYFDAELVRGLVRKAMEGKFTE
jgi:hypothetical protein